MLSSLERQELIKKYGQSKDNTGSLEAQVAILTKEIQLLTEHFKNHKKDDHSKRGLYQKIAKRKTILEYLKDKDYSSYESLVSSLGIRSK